MSNRVLKVLGNVNKANPLYVILKENIELIEIINLSDAESEDLIVVDAKSAFSGEYYLELCKCLQRGNGILFLDVDTESKINLSKYIGIYKKGDSVALFLKCCGENKFLINNLSIDNLYEAKGLMKSKTNKITEGTRKDLERRQISKFILNLFYSDMIEVHFSDDSNFSKDIEQGIENRQWMHTEYYDWAAWESYQWDDYIPRAQELYGTITYTICGIKNHTATGEFQWIYIGCKGMWSTSKSGINQDWHNERGWYIGSINLTVETPIDNVMPYNFHLYNFSPKSINKSKTNKTEISFDIEYGEKNYKFENSNTDDFEGWEVVLNSNNNWTFKQDIPYIYQNEEFFPQFTIDYNAKAARHEIKHLPSLSKDKINFDTMSVWRNGIVSPDKIVINLSLGLQYNYQAIKNNWPDWDGNMWKEFIYTKEQYVIDLNRLDLL